jgi:hypothetical protein
MAQAVWDLQEVLQEAMELRLEVQERLGVKQQGCPELDLILAHYLPLNPAQV